MVALRKDVKVGLTIGAIAVSVIGVYAGLSALAGEKPADTNTAKLDFNSDGSTKKAPTTPIVADRSGTGSSSIKPTTPNTTLLATNTTGSGSAGTSTPPSANPTEANPTGTTSVAAANGEDPWAVAFGSGNVQPKKTITPTPGTKADPIADRASTIQSINGDPKADATKTASANANDGSGSMTSGGTSVLTKASEPAAPAGPEKSHTVAPGETFSSIATEYYGDSKYFTAIITANPSVNPNKLKPGTVLKIPAIAKKDAKSDTNDLPSTGIATASTKIDTTKQYVVKPGDSLHKISSTLWNDSSMSTKLYDLNKSVIGADPTKLKPGMILTLPTAPTEKKAS